MNILSRRESGVTDQISMLLGRDPNMAITPFTQFSEFLHFEVSVINIIFHREPFGVKHAHVTTESKQNARRFQRYQAGVGPINVVRGRKVDDGGQTHLLRKLP
jgi:hypothetical protein